jgi:hypothetical protein
MFYSQYILAKRGPLGTIWIAAHLDRRLRKQQITETDVATAVRACPRVVASPRMSRASAKPRQIWHNQTRSPRARSLTPVPSPLAALALLNQSPS